MELIFMKRMFHLIKLFYDTMLNPDEEKRRYARGHATRQFAKGSNVQIYHRHSTWYMDEGYMTAWSMYPETSNQFRDKEYQLFQLAKSVANLEGDTAECGVFRGKGSFLICKALQESRPFTHHAFDSFEGLSAPSEEDKQFKYDTGKLVIKEEDIKVWQENDLSVGLDTAKINLQAFDFIKYYKGWIPERFDEVADKQFKFVHIDVDIYEPTKQSLEFFYPRVVSGGIILCDDYGWVDCPGAKKAMDDFFSDKSESVVHLTTSQGLVVKR
jgi:hypothetical protein